MYVSKLVRALETAGLLRRADHLDDSRAFQLELSARGAGLLERAAAVMEELFDRLLTPIGGRTGKLHVALVRTLESLLDEAEAIGRENGPQAPDAPRRPLRRIGKRRSLTTAARPGKGRRRSE
jgi:hypothetical protein